MAKRKSPPKQKPAEQGFNLQQTITQSVVAWDDVAFAKLLETQAMALGELTSVKTLLTLSKEVKQAERSVSSATTVPSPAPAGISAASSASSAPSGVTAASAASAAPSGVTAIPVASAERATPTPVPTPVASAERATPAAVASSSAAPSAPIDYRKIQEEMLKVAKEQFKGSRRSWKLQEDFQKEWDKEAKNIAEMAKGMKTFKTLSEKMADKKEGLKEKFGVANGGLKKTVLGALNVGGVFNKTLEKDKFIEQQKALGAAPQKGESPAEFKKRLSADFEGAQSAAKETKKTEKQIDKIKAAAANGGAEISEEQLKASNPEFAKLLEKRQSNADEFGKYQRATDIYSPTPVTRSIADNLEMPAAAQSAKMMEKRQSNPSGAKETAGVNSPTAANKNTADNVRTAGGQGLKVAQKSTMSNLVPTPSVPELGKTTSPTATAAESAQVGEEVEEGKRKAEENLKYIKIIAENTGGKNKNAGDKKPEPSKAEGGGLLDTIMSFLGTGLLAAFKSIFNPMSILKALGKVFAIGMIIGALFEGVMDGFNEFMKTGDIGKALIAGLAGIINFLTFGLFDKEKIKEVIGDFSKWIGDHIIKPFTNFISGIKDSFMGFLEKIGIPKITLANATRLTPEVSVGPFYPFKSDKTPTAAEPTAAAPTTANQVEAQSAQNADAKDKPKASSTTAVVNAPVTTNNNSTQVSFKPPSRNQDASHNSYTSSRYAR